MSKPIRITDLSPEQLAELKPLIDESVQKALTLRDLEIAKLRSENADLRRQLDEAKAELAQRNGA